MCQTRAFTLVEVVVVSALILLASLVAFHTAEIVSQREKEERLRYALLDMRAALDIFFQDSHQNPAISAGQIPRFPKTIDEMLLTKRPVPGGSFYLRRLPLNPMLKNTNWHLVIATITDDITSELVPVITDVRCPDTVTPPDGLNGIPYKDW
ncbi:MAG: hypothetical protein CVV41_17010 [Candidatus Riflebacteria bacterium HGW-Riflebacteria-1]|nr:MAG: hypothetical protein CVV41_17010 [Candidatus Riflebacteria bacterium HGW-Riflebacteria-1]